MYHRARNFLVAISIVCVGLFITSSASAEAIITAVNANPANIPFGYSTNISWVMQDNYGAFLTFYCPTGLAVYNVDGSSFPCNTPTAVTSNSVGITFANTTGNTASVRVHITPKDGAGTGYEGGSMDTYLSIGAIPFPITDFTASTNNIVSGGHVTLTWKGNTGVTGSNIQFDCSNDLQFLSITPAIQETLTCGALVYTSNLAGSGSVTVSATNSTLATTTARARVLPMIVSGFYDGTHSMSLLFDVGPRIVVQPGSVTNFTATANRLVSGNQTTLSWNTQNTKAVNLQFTCTSGISTHSGVGTSTQALPCGIPAFTQSVSGTTTSTFMLINTTGLVQNISVLVFPQNADGTYNGTRGAQTNLLVYPPTITPTPPPTPPVSIPVTGIATSPVTQTKTFTSIKGATTFTQYLVRGSSKSQVKQLQQLLSQDATLYPEQLVTGYFGPATDRALKRFQERYTIARPGDEGYGLVGPKTRAKLNSLLDL